MRIEASIATVATGATAAIEGLHSITELVIVILTLAWWIRLWWNAIRSDSDKIPDFPVVHREKDNGEDSLP